MTELLRQLQPPACAPPPSRTEFNSGGNDLGGKLACQSIWNKYKNSDSWQENISTNYNKNVTIHFPKVQMNPGSLCS